MADVVKTRREAERALVLGCAPARGRAGLASLLALDARLGDLLRQTREPIMAQLRLAWWREALTSLGQGSPPVDPVLIAVAAEIVPRGVSGAALAGMIDGWEALLEEPLGQKALATHARDRGGALFAAAARAMGGEPEAVRAMGEGWALADFAANVTDPKTAALASSLARQRFAAAPRSIPLGLRSLSGLALLARMDLSSVAPASPRRIARLALFRVTGR